MEINYCLKKGKGKGNLYLPSFVVTLFCRRALISPRSYVARSFVARFFCGALLSRYPRKRYLNSFPSFYSLLSNVFCKNTKNTDTN
jgi:hypothetical protein